LLHASKLSTHRCEEELGIPLTSSSTGSVSRLPSSLPPLDTSVPSTHSLSASGLAFSGSPISANRRTSVDVQRVASFDSAGGYFSGAELSSSPREEIHSVEPVTPGIIDRQSFETDELEGLAEDRVVAQGYLLCLKNVSGVRQWKRRWVVLRARSLTLYKNFEVLPPPPFAPTFAGRVDGRNINHSG
jgi:hypothetical protein